MGPWTKRRTLPSYAYRSGRARGEGPKGREQWDRPLLPVFGLFRPSMVLQDADVEPIIPEVADLKYGQGHPPRGGRWVMARMFPSESARPPKGPQEPSFALR